MKKVSIIIAAYNEEKYIEKCLSSLEKQSYKPLEIIVADDGSTDNTVKIAEKHKITLLQSNHQGTALARNNAAKAATGEILVFLDADMEFEHDFIARLVQPINENKQKGTFSKLEYVKNWDEPLARCWNKLNPALPVKMRVMQDSDVGDDFRAILRSEFIKVGGFDNTGYTDTWSLKHKLGYRPVNAPGAKYYHYNPETMLEVYDSASWIGKRSYKGGIIGKMIALLRSFFVVSLIKGVFKAITMREPYFPLFYLVYDAGITNGIVRSTFFQEVKK
ncbi:MAG: glycosyltransferase family 2 protein [Weeksellaceae bacterium]